MKEDSLRKKYTFHKEDPLHKKYTPYNNIRKGIACAQLRPAVFFLLMLFCSLMASAVNYKCDGGFLIKFVERDAVSIGLDKETFARRAMMEEEFHFPKEVVFEGKTYRVTGVMERAFEDCWWVKHVVIDEWLEHIGQFAFQRCINLESVHISAGVTYVMPGLFCGCNKLKRVEVDERNEFLDSRDGCNAIIHSDDGTLLAACLASTIPAGVLTIGEWAFGGSEFTEFAIPEGVKNIGRFAFAGCANLRHIHLPNTLEEIDVDAFRDCVSLEEIVIPASVRQIIPVNQPFLGCTSLRSIKVAKKNPVFDSRKNCNAIILTKSNKLIAGCAASTIPEGVDSIESCAFFGTPITEIHVPASMKFVESGSLIGIHQLVKITVSKRNERYYSPEGSNCLMERAGDRLVAGCRTSRIPDCTKEIGQDAFNNGILDTPVLQLPEGLERIGRSAFNRCKNLQTIVTPSTLKEIDSWAFASCNDLCLADLSRSQLQKIGPFTFDSCPELSVVSLPQMLQTIGNSTFRNCPKLYSINLPSSLNKIHFEAFTDSPCKKAIRIQLPDIHSY